MNDTNQQLAEAAQVMKNSKHCVAFTGAGISVESGIPPFRGPSGLWAKYDPMILDLNFYLSKPEQSWPVIKELFFDFFGHSRPNEAHYALARLEEKGIIKEIITQNIDNLHQEAGSKTVHEFHGNSVQFVCTRCGKITPRNKLTLSEKPPRCPLPSCGGLLKPDFIFFGEGIPQKAYEASVRAANIADCFLVIGTTGEIMPASYIPLQAKENGAKIIEINIEKSNFTDKITDIFIQEKASAAMTQLEKLCLAGFS